MALNVAIVLVAAIAMAGLALPRLYRQASWRAMTTPLASIIGSGFLVLGPILNVSYGLYAPLAMVMLCAFAYLFGWAIRFNIAAIDGADGRSDRVEWLEKVSSWSLAFAYVISVTYYLNLFGAFGLSLTPFDDPLYSRMLTSVVFLVIAAVGWMEGFSVLEELEYGAGILKLAIIAGVFVGLIAFFRDKVQTDQLVFNAPQKTGINALTLAFGLLITVQGFETSRYLGDEYDARTRMFSMRLAQWVSAAIYLVYTALLAYVFAPDQLKLTDTAIISLMHVVATVLPAMLVAAALAAQFSAAIADTSGAGELVQQLTGDRIKPRRAYLVLTALGLIITWVANVFDIINYASRAFAVYYAFQALIAALTARNQKKPVWKQAAFLGLALLAVAIAIFGVSAEG